jgi:hypothetical protein
MRSLPSHKSGDDLIARIESPEMHKGDPLIALLSRIPTWAGLVPGHVLLLAHLAHYAYVDVDDAYIAFRYARNFALGDGLLFNPGEPPVEGYSAFLWVITLAGLARIGLEIPSSAQVLGAILSILAWIGMVLILRRSGSSKYAAWIAGLWLAASGSYAMWSMSGLETGLVAVLVILSYGLLAREELHGSGYLSGFSLALLGLARAEGVIFFVSALVLKAVMHLRGQSARTVREDTKWLLAFVIPFLGFMIWRVSYYGTLVPNAVFAKSGGGYLYHALRGAYYTFQFLAAGAALLVFLIAAVALLRFDRPVVRYGVVGLAAYSALILFAGGDWMPQFRFFAPVMPLICMLGAIGLEAIGEQWRDVSAARARALAATLAVVIFGLFLGGSIQVSEIDRSVRAFVAPTKGGHDRAAWLHDNSRQGDSMALVDSGILAYETDLQIIDMIGLNDAHIAHLSPQFPRGLAPGNGFGKWDVDYVFSLEPTYIQVHLSREKWEGGELETDWVGSDELINDPRFLLSYQYVEDPRVGGIFVRKDRDGG